MTPQQTRILIVDDEPKYTRALTAILEATGYEILVAADGAAAVETAARAAPHLILLDVRLPILNGHEVCRRVREFSLAPVIMLSALAQKADIVQGLEAGADDYIIKPFSADELLARVHAGLRRSTYTEPHLPTGEPVFRAGGLFIDYARCQVTVDGHEVHLTPTEYRLLCELTRAAGRVVANEVILENVWGTGYSREDQLIPRVMHRLRQKIEPNADTPRFILTRPGLGYMFQKENRPME